MTIKPHRSRYWLNRPDPDFDAKMQTIVELYVDPPANSVVLCFDERTSMQAVQRKHPTKPMKPGLIGRRTFEYVRRGTLDLLAALQVHTGEASAACYDGYTQWEMTHRLVGCYLNCPSAGSVIWCWII